MICIDGSICIHLPTRPSLGSVSDKDPPTAFPRMESVPVTPCKGHPSKRQSRPCLVENGNQMAEVEFFQWIPTKISNWQRVLQQILGIRIRMCISLLQNWHIFMVFSDAPCILDGSHRLAAVCMLYLVISASNTSSCHQDTKSCCFPLGEQVSQGLNRWAQIGMKTPQILGDLVTCKGEMCFCCNRNHLVNRWISEKCSIHSTNSGKPQTGGLTVTPPNWPGPKAHSSKSSARAAAWSKAQRHIIPTLTITLQAPGCSITHLLRRVDQGVIWLMHSA